MAKELSAISQLVLGVLFVTVIVLVGSSLMAVIYRPDGPSGDPIHLINFTMSFWPCMAVPSLGIGLLIGCVSSDHLSNYKAKTIIKSFVLLLTLVAIVLTVMFFIQLTF